MNACRLTMPQIRIVDGVAILGFDDLTRAPNLRRSTRVLDAGDNPHCQHLAVCTGQQAWRRILYRVKPLRSLRRVHPSRGSVEDADSARFELWHAERAETATNYLQCRTLGLGPAPHLGTLPFAETAPSVRSPASVASSPVEPEPRSSIAPCGALAAQPSIPLSAASRSYRCLPQNCHSRVAVFADRPRAYATNRSYAPLCSQEKVTLRASAMMPAPVQPVPTSQRPCRHRRGI
jgi:hypothetical protein